MRSLKINRLLPIYISTLPLTFGVDIQSQSKVSWRGVYWIHLVRPSVCPYVCRRHGFRSISQVCFGISISNFICMLMVAIGRSLLIFSDVTFKMAAWRPYWIFYWIYLNQMYMSLVIRITWSPNGNSQFMTRTRRAMVINRELIRSDQVIHITRRTHIWILSCTFNQSGLNKVKAWVPFRKSSRWACDQGRMKTCGRRFVTVVKCQQLQQAPVMSPTATNLDVC